MRKLGVLAVAIALGATPGATAAPPTEECKLVRVGSADMAEINDPRVYVHAMFGDEKKSLLIDSGMPETVIASKVADDLHLPKRDIAPNMLFTSTGQSFRQSAVLPSLTVGDIRVENVRALIDPAPLDNDQVGGTIGANLFLRNDVEFDFVQRKVNFFSQDHCPGRVVYWPAAAIAAVPMRIMRVGYLIISVSVDGHPMDAILDTGQPTTFLDLERAEAELGVKIQSPDVAKVPTSDSDTRAYSRTFTTLDFNGVSISNVAMIMVHNLEEGYERNRLPFAMVGIQPKTSAEQRGKVPLILGMHELRSLHLYFSYKEKLLYVTGPSAAGH